MISIQHLIPNDSAAEYLLFFRLLKPCSFVPDLLKKTTGTFCTVFLYPSFHAYRTHAKGLYNLGLRGIAINNDLTCKKKENSQYLLPDADIPASFR